MIHTLERRHQPNPEQIRAIQYLGSNLKECQEFCPELRVLPPPSEHGGTGVSSLLLWTRSGYISCSVTDWIVRKAFDWTILSNTWLEIGYRRVMPLDERMKLKPVRIGFDIGGVLSKYPEIFRSLLYALHCGGAEVFIITDMHDHKQTLEMLALNGFDFISADHVLSSDFQTYGEACKAVLLEELKLDVFLDDFPAYVAAGCPVRLQLLSDLTRPYYADSWQVPSDVGDFGRRKRVDRYLQTKNSPAQ